MTVIRSAVLLYTVEKETYIKQQQKLIKTPIYGPTLKFSLVLWQVIM